MLKQKSLIKTKKKIIIINIYNSIPYEGET